MTIDASLSTGTPLNPKKISEKGMSTILTVASHRLPPALCAFVTTSAHGPWRWKLNFEPWFLLVLLSHEHELKKKLKKLFLVVMLMVSLQYTDATIVFGDPSEQS